MRRHNLRSEKKLLTLIPPRALDARRVQEDIDAREGEIFIRIYARVSTSADLVNS